MANFIINIETGNSAFKNNELNEVCRILKKMIDRIETDDYYYCGHYKLQDYNGNTVGTFELKLDK